MFPRVRGVRHVKDYVLHLTFSDGTVAELDFRRRIVGRGGIFAPLESVDFFKQVTVDREAGTLVWPNGVDLCGTRERQIRRASLRSVHLMGDAGLALVVHGLRRLGNTHRDGERTPG